MNELLVDICRWDRDNNYSEKYSERIIIDLVSQNCI